MDAQGVLEGDGQLFVDHYRPRCQGAELGWQQSSSSDEIVNQLFICAREALVGHLAPPPTEADQAAGL